MKLRCQLFLSLTVLLTLSAACGGESAVECDGCGEGVDGGRNAAAGDGGPGDGASDSDVSIFDGADTGAMIDPLSDCLVDGDILVVSGDMGSVFPSNARLTGGVGWQFGGSDVIGGEPATVGITYGTNWTFVFSSNELGTPLAIGTYSNVQRQAFAQPGHPGLDVNTPSDLGCDTVTGQFEVLAVEAAESTITSFTAAFEHHCEGASAAFRGCVHVQM